MSPVSRLPLAVLMLLGVAAALAACRADTTGLATLDVAGLEALRASGADVVLCDANGAEVRERDGVIPGAVLLSSYRDYDPARELPADPARPLVFYCYSPLCGAAADAARKAVAAGHRDVWVMTDGIRGWNEAGLPVERPPAEGVSG